MSKTAFLKEKTDAQCRQLAAQYYVRARKAEKERDEALDLVKSIRKENNRLLELAHEMLESDQ